MTGSQLFPLTLGPLAPYLVCSSAGFAFGSWFIWRTERARALYWSKLYPEVIAHHMLLSYRITDVQSTLSNVQHGKAITLGNMSWLILGTQSAMGDILDIQTQKLNLIAEKYVQKDDSS